jgi:hypothetical protein
MVYNPTYDQDNKVASQLTKDEFFYLVNNINDTLRAYWPCTATILIGYLLAPFTFGLSFLLPNLCISDAKTALIKVIERQNRIKLHDRCLHLSYVQGFSTAWLELSVRHEPSESRCEQHNAKKAPDNHENEIIQIEDITL